MHRVLTPTASLGRFSCWRNVSDYPDSALTRPTRVDGEIQSGQRVLRDISSWHPLSYRLPYTPRVPRAYLRRLGSNIEAVMGLST